MPGISFGGLASGLDTNAIVRQLVALESQPLQRLNSSRQSLVNSQSKFGEFKSKLQALSEKITRFKDRDQLGVYGTTSSNEDLLQVSAAGIAAPGSHTVRVNALAAAQTTSYLSPVADRDTSTFGAGTVELTVNGETTSVSIADTDTLDDVRDKINAAGGGVNASIIFDGTDHHLVLSSENTGLDNAFTATTTGFDQPGDFNPFGASTVLTAAANASFEIDGIAITSQSNSVSNALDGVTFDLQDADPAELITINIERDVQGIGDRVDEFVTAFNDVIDFVNAQSDSNDPTARGIRRALDGVLNRIVPAGDSALYTFGGASQIGLQRTGGRLSLDRATLESAIEQDFAGVTEFFAGDASATEFRGLATEFDRVLNGYSATPGGPFTVGILGAGGLASVREDAIGNRIRGLDSRIETAQKRLDRFEQRELRRFAAFEALTSQYQAQGSFLSQAFQ